MKRLTLTLLFVAATLAASAQTLLLDDIRFRDPYILADQKSQTYYLYLSSTTKSASGKVVGGVKAYTSKDLIHWNEPVQVFTCPDDNWITGNVWAPEVHQYKGKYYLFATLNTDLTWKGGKNNSAPYTFRGTQIFWSKSPLGPFKAFSTDPHTPIDQMALDGTLWVEDVDLWIRMLQKGYKFHVIPDVLLRYRYDYNSVRRQTMQSRINGAKLAIHGRKALNLSLKYDYYALRTVAIGLIPAPMRYLLQMKRLKR